MDCAIRRTHGALSNQRVLGVFLVALWVASSVSTVWAQPEAEAEVYLYVDPDGDGVKEEITLSATTPALQGKIPVLFVHGHNLMSADDADFNFRKNWQQVPSGLTSFKETLDLSENAWLDIEPYYIRFQDQHRSIVEDAQDIAWAVEHILRRHDGHTPFTSTPSTNVKVAIIGYSKGTISSRLYLKSLQPPPEGEEGYDLPPPRNGFNPVSEFIAIAPPNHGLAANLGDLALALGDLSILFSVALKQLNNGYMHNRHNGHNCDPYSLQTAESQDFIQNLNGHAITDTMPPPSAGPNWSPGPYDTEASGSRDNSSPPSVGTLYVNLYANSDVNKVARDLVEGEYPSDDCQGRVLAKNLAPDAENIEVSAIPGSVPKDVHVNTVHTPEVICLALYTVARHRVPDPETFACETVGQIPIIPQPPRPLPWWWWIITTLVVVSIIPFIYWLRQRAVRFGT